MERDIFQYLNSLRRWWWLILVTMIVIGGLTFFYAGNRTPLYRAETTILVGSFIEAPNPDVAEIRTGIELAQVYIELVKTHEVLQGTVEALQLPISADALRSRVSVSVTRNTALLRIRVLYEDPTLAAAIANGITEQLILKSPSNLTAEQENQIQFLQQQIDASNAQVETARQQLSELEPQIQNAASPQDAESLTNRYNEIVGQINETTAIIAQFSDTIATLRQRTNSVDVVDSARVPTYPTGTSTLKLTFFGLVLGVVMGGGIALMLEYLNDSIRTSEDVAQAVALPVLASVPRFGHQRDPYAQRLINREDIHPSVAESYRRLRTNLLFANADEAKKVYVITSPGPSEGKSVTTANLAIAMAMAGLRVLLIDADMRRPTIHKLFGLSNEVGLSTLLLADSTPAHVPHTINGHDNGGAAKVDFRACLQDTQVDKLRVISSGPIPANPTELLGSLILRRWIDVFRSSSNIDLVLFDTPPCLAVADAATVAVSAKADVLMVIQAGRTRQGQAIRAKEQFQSVDLEIKGVVLNRFNPRDEYYSYRYYNYYYYYSSHDDSAASEESQESSAEEKEGVP